MPSKSKQVKKMQVKQLTKAEEQVMQLLWKLEKATVQQLLEQMPEPKPARTTVATILSILENKEFANHTTEGKKTNIYFPVIAKEEYSRTQLSGILKNYFDNSFASLTSFFVKENNLSIEELDTLLRSVSEELKTKSEESQDQRS